MDQDEWGEQPTPEDYAEWDAQDESDALFEAGYFDAA